MRTTRKGYYRIIGPDGLYLLNEKGDIRQVTSRDSAYEYITEDGRDGKFKIKCPDWEVDVSLIATSGRVAGTWTPDGDPEGSLPAGWSRVTTDPGGALTAFDSDNNTISQVNGTFTISVIGGIISNGGTFGATDYIDAPGITIPSANDFTLICRINSESGDAAASSRRVGWDIRESSDTGSIHAYLYWRPDGMRLVERTATDNDAANVPPNPYDTATSLPQWHMILGDRATGIVRFYVFFGATNPGTDPDTNWTLIRERTYSWTESGDLVALLAASPADGGNNGYEMACLIDNVTADFTASHDFSTPVEAGVIWPEQDAWGGVVPAVRNRNADSSGVVCAGRGHGMDGRHAYALATIGSPTTGTTPAIIHVTNRNDSGAGSFREACLTSGPRIVVFDVGGPININSDISIDDPYLLIAGQTAPSQVIINNTGVGDHCFRIRTGDVFIQHMIFWHSALPEFPGVDNGNNDNALVIAGGSGDFNNVVIDHCMIGGGTDQVMLILSNAHGITMVDSIVCCARGKDPEESAGNNFHQYLASLGGNSPNEDPDNLTLVGNLFTHGKERVPSIVIPNTTACNNLVYNRTVIPMVVRGKSAQTTQYFINMLGNIDLRGPDYSGSFGTGFVAIGRGDGNQSFAAGSKMYCNDNVSADYVSDEWDGVSDPDNQEGDIRQETPVTESFPTGLVAAPVRNLSASDRLTLILNNIGPRPNERITYIQDIIDDIISGDGDIQTDYATPTSSITSLAYSEAGMSHDEGSEAGRSVWETKLLDDADDLMN